MVPAALLTYVATWTSMLCNLLPSNEDRLNVTMQIHPTRHTECPFSSEMYKLPVNVTNF